MTSEHSEAGPLIEKPVFTNVNEQAAKLAATETDGAVEQSSPKEPELKLKGPIFKLLLPTPQVF